MTMQLSVGKVAETLKLALFNTGPAYLSKETAEGLPLRWCTMGLRSLARMQRQRALWREIQSALRRVSDTCRVYGGEQERSGHCWG